jgi:predicted deacetylase
MDLQKWLSLEAIFDKYRICPIVAVIPNNEDNTLVYQSEIKEFWDIVRRWQDKGWTVALHGYNHVYSTNDSGILSINNYSEFSGVDPVIQETKIKLGMQILRNQGVYPKCWIAPAHSFDENTINILKWHTNIEFISDGYALFPYQEYGMKWLPQLTSTPRKFLFGVWTFCLHPSTMSVEQIEKIESFLKKNGNNTVKFDDITDSFNDRNRNVIDYFLQYFFVSIRNLKFFLRSRPKTGHSC